MPTSVSTAALAFGLILVLAGLAALGVALAFIAFLFESYLFYTAGKT